VRGRDCSITEFHSNPDIVSVYLDVKSRPLFVIYPFQLLHIPCLRCCFFLHGITLAGIADGFGS